jgi:KUP system potassium uptake protein
MRADNQGEGGIFALMSLVGANDLRGSAKVLACIGTLGAALIYGDGVITPAISVLSALEGVNVVTDSWKPYVMPGAVTILVVLFATQRFATEKIGRAFGRSHHVGVVCDHWLAGRSADYRPSDRSLGSQSCACDQPSSF